MTDKPHDNVRFEQLARELAREEIPLREHFARTPPLSDAAMDRLKLRLRAEVRAIHRQRPAQPAWLRHLAAAAATVLLALGLTLWVRSGSIPAAGGPAPTRVASAAALETFAANLSTILTQEDAEVRELYTWMEELETQAAGVTTDFDDLDEPAAQGPRASDPRQIAAG